MSMMIFNDLEEEEQCIFELDRNDETKRENIALVNRCWRKGENERTNALTTAPTSTRACEKKGGRNRTISMNMSMANRHAFH